jgi:membrane protein
VRRAAGTLAQATRRLLVDDGLVLAGALSFSVLMCLAPLALLSASAAGFLLTAEDVNEHILNAIASLVPGYGTEVAKAVSVLVHERQVTGLLGAASLAVFASQLFALMRAVLNTAFRVEQGRGYLHGFAFDLMALGIFSIGILVLAAGTLATLALGALAERMVPGMPGPVAEWARRIVVVFLYTGLVVQLFLIYRTFANTRVPARAAGVATVVVVVLWELARRGAATYFADYALYGTLYGSFAAAVAVLVWIYASAVIFVWGALLTAALAGVPATAVVATAESAPPLSGGGVFRLVLAAVLVGLGVAGAAALVLQNAAPVSFRLLWWQIGAIPSGALVAGAFVGGGILGGGVTALWLRRRPRATPRGRQTDSGERRTG